MCRSSTAGSWRPGRPGSVACLPAPRSC
jgi:hypothetical protein